MTAPVSVRGFRSPAWRLAFIFSGLAVVVGLGLAGVSGWFLAAVAVTAAGPAALAFNFHIPAALVRLFALLRTGAKYGERLKGHRAAIGDQIAHRAALFQSFATSNMTRSSGWQLSRSERLSDFLDDVDAVEFDVLRSSFPAVTFTAALALLALATAAFAPLALVPLLVMCAAALVWPRVRMAIAAREHSARGHSREGASLLGRALEAVVQLAAENRQAVAFEGAVSPYKRVEDLHTLDLCAQAKLEALFSTFGPLMAISVLVAAHFAGMTGAELLPAVFVAFAWLGLGEGAMALARAAVGRVKATAAREAIANGMGQGAEMPLRDGFTRGYGDLEIRGLVPRDPRGRALAGAISLRVSPGAPLALVGPSGCGKTSLLKQVAGWLPAPAQAISTGAFLLDENARRMRSHLCLHDAVILSDTVRENLFSPDAPDAVLWDALSVVELDAVVRRLGGLDGWVTQDQISTGEAQRLNLARALLSTKPVILLDEPGEHLGSDQARRICAALFERLNDRIVIFSSHDRGLAHAARFDFDDLHP